MSVDYADCLQISINRSCTYKLHPALFEIFGNIIGQL